MSPLNRGPLIGGRIPPAGMRPLPPPRFGGMPPRMPLPMSPVFSNPGPLRQRLLPMLPPRPAGLSRPNGLLPNGLFPGPRVRGMVPGIAPPMLPRGLGPRNPMRHWYRRIPPPPLPPQMIPPRFVGNGSAKSKALNNTKKVNKLEVLELKKPWMTDEIRTEIQKKNKLYAKAKKNKDAVEWEEFKDLRNKVTRMIRDAKNEYLTKHPEQLH
ncbi:PREDICTED: DNA-binding protein K10-like isoform X2 [Dinoponera quadriceps]|uniref:DNA-binding protein K10-like isoform X2 n=1 Tax=Dinoponera quadriceps TaxID=609295 RepID=A0A6P3Y1B6_DINQU|nr:PREDICTED: DNA-binding protein K10-like isoform X2 [Dinoponera quadriceps]